jgi:hypothetical protein
MADRLDEFGDDLGGDDAADAAEQPTAQGDDTAAESSGDAAAAGSGGEDPRSWQSKYDKSEAKANRLQKELDAVRASAAAGVAPPPAPARRNGAVDPWVEASKDNFRDELYKSDPRFASLGLEPTLIVGATPGEMRSSFDSLRTSVDRMESGIRQRVLVEHGLEPEVGSGERATNLNYGTMPKEEFDKLVERALGG